MMPVERWAAVIWEKDLLSGRGTVTTGSEALGHFPVSWSARVETPGGKTSPEELLAAAHASCYAMAFSSTLSKRGTPSEELQVKAVCTFDKMPEGWRVTKMDLEVHGRVPGIDQAQFEEAAREGEKGCPISNALRNNVQITVTAKLL